MSEADDLNKIRALQQAYSRTFKTEDGKIVLEDLENRYCIHKTTADPNPYFTHVNEGMRSVVLYVKQMLKMTIKKQEELKNDQKGKS